MKIHRIQLQNKKTNSIKYNNKSTMSMNNINKYEAIKNDSSIKII